MAYFKSQKKNMLFLPLGDSYTIGTGVSEKESWPFQLLLKLNERGLEYSLPINPAQNGFTTADLIRRELPILQKGPKPDLITLLIGVNDWVQGVDKNEFQKNLEFILKQMKANLNEDGHLIVITIPNFGKTPSGRRYAHGRNISEGLSEFNEVIKEEAKKYNIITVDVFHLSEAMEFDSSLVADDGLHPSGKEYGLWAELILNRISTRR